MFSKKYLLCSLACVSGVALQARHDVLLEAKAAYFLSSNHTFREIYDNGSGLYGLELTPKIYKGLYGFFSLDGFTKKGYTQNFCTPTKASFIELGFGLKYLFPFAYKSTRFTGDFYLGLGVLPTWLQTTNDSPYVTNKLTNWGCGGIAKVGTFFNLPHDFFVDVFIDYQFVTISPKCCPGSGTQPRKANLGGAIFGVGLGYRFN